MAKQTIQQQVAAKLVEAGYREVFERTRKYRVFSNGSERKYYLGKSGAVRVGRTATDNLAINYQRVLAGRFV